jgi:hypothetical protein
MTRVLAIGRKLAARARRQELCRDNKTLNRRTRCYNDISGSDDQKHDQALGRDRKRKASAAKCLGNEEGCKHFL